MGESSSFGLPYVLFVLVISHFGFEGETLVQIASVPGLFLVFTSVHSYVYLGVTKIFHQVLVFLHIDIFDFSHRLLFFNSYIDSLCFYIIDSVIEVKGLLNEYLNTSLL